ncbi:methyltransferase domain-containing protein [Synechocystis salina LEGE 06155]|nr:methyltransferase domain-containing protein [Synechocystis salina LEGE 06155]
MHNQYVQYGCGWSAPENWRNFDASPTLRFERLPIIGDLYTKNSKRFPSNVEFGDIVHGLPVPNNACKGIYCSHILEHLSLNDFRTALKNTHNILSPGGYFRLVLPDLEHLTKEYLKDSSDGASLIFLRATSLGRETKSRNLKEFILDWFGNSYHLWMWDFKSIAQELKNAGFIEIRRAQHGDCVDPMFKDVEELGRWLNCLGVECRKSSC